MDSKLQLFAKVLLKEHYDEFLEMIQLFNIDKRTFVLQHRKMFEKGWYDTSSEDNEFSEVDIMLCFAIVSPIIFIFLGLLMFGSVPLIQTVCCLLSVYFFCFNLASKLFNFFSIFIHNYRVPYSK